MSRRTIPDRTRVWLLREIEIWREEGFLSRQQSTEILDLYETPGEVAERKRSSALIVLMGLAALMVGLAALLLVGYNWAAMPPAAKLAVIFTAILGTHVGGIVLRYRYDARLWSEAAFLLGCLFYGVGIWQIAQIFHIQTHYPNGVWMWAVGVLLFALCLDTPLLHALFVSLMALWAGMEIIGFGDLGGWLFGRWRALPNGAYSLPLLSLPGMLWAYRKGSAATVAMYAPLLAWWVILQPVTLHWEMNVVYFIGAVGGLFLLVAQVHRQGSPFAVTYRLYGVLLTAGVLVPMSFYDFSEELTYDAAGSDAVTYGLLAGPIIVALAVAVLALAALLKRKYAQDPAPISDQMLAVVRRGWLPVGVILAMAVLPMANSLLDSCTSSDLPAVLTTILANVAMIVLAVWLMRVGLREDRGSAFAAGVLYFLLWTILRYADLFADFGGMLGASLMFFLCGAGLFAVALYWRRRKEIQRV